MDSRLSFLMASALAGDLTNSCQGRSVTAGAHALFAAGEAGAFFDNSDLSTMFSDAGGTIPAAVDGPVLRQLDKSGNGNHRTFFNAILRSGAGLYWIEYNGANTYALTPSVNFTSTDKMTLWVALRKASDAAAAAFIGLGSNVVANSFELTAPANVGTNDIQFRSSGSTTAAARALGFPVGENRIFTCIGDIAADSCALRMGGVQVAASAADQGNGTYGNQQLCFGRRIGAGLFFSGREYASIVRGAASSAEQISAGNALMAARSGATL